MIKYMWHKLKDLSSFPEPMWKSQVVLAGHLGTGKAETGGFPKIFGPTRIA